MTVIPVFLHPRPALASTFTRCAARVKCLLGVLALCLAAAVAPAQSLPGWTLVWSDEFDGPDVDLSKWEFQIGDGCPGLCGWGNNELQYYTSRTNNARIVDGKLVIEARAESFGGKNYTSARLRTLNKGDWKYGRFEARIKLPYGQGIWPAFWMMPTDSVYGGWAASGEIDIMEMVGHQPNVIHGTIHYGGPWPHNVHSGNSWTLPSGNFSDDFHVFALEWEEGVMRWYVDGIHYSTRTSWHTTGGAPFPAPFDQRFHLLLNLAVGGNWPGNPDGTTVFPQQLVVDYVRVYARPVEPPTSSGVLINGGFETGSLAPWVGTNFCCANPAGGNVVSTNGLVWDPTINANNTQGIRNPAFGAYSCKLYGNFSGSPNSPGFYQDVVALPGSVWTATIKARTQHTDHIRQSNHALAEVSFLNASDTVLATYASQTFTTNMPINTWVDLDVNQQVLPPGGTTNLLHAPPGTVKARFAVTFHQALYQWGSIYFDEAQLHEVVLQPTTLNIMLQDDTLEISFPTQPLLNYRVAYKADITDPNWTTLTTVAGDGTVKTVTDSLGDGYRLYIVETVY